MKIGRLLVVFIFVMMFLIVFGDRGFIDYYSLQGKLTSLREENDRIVRGNSVLKREIVMLNNDMRYIEKVAREELGMVKEGEFVYRFVE